MLRRNGTRRHVVWCVSGWGASEGRVVALWGFEARMSAPAGNGSAPWGCSFVESPGGLDLIEVCARWCPTLPHPGGCSTIGAVRLSFRVRDGAGRFPVAVTTETTRWAVLVTVISGAVIRLLGCLPTRTHAWCVCWWLGWVWTV